MVSFMVYCTGVHHLRIKISLGHGPGSPHPQTIAPRGRVKMRCTVLLLWHSQRRVHAARSSPASLPRMILLLVSRHAFLNVIEDDLSCIIHRTLLKSQALRFLLQESDFFPAGGTKLELYVLTTTWWHHDMGHGRRRTKNLTKTHTATRFPTLQVLDLVATWQPE
ncbi:hypothetical protein PLICRDRAFT_615711 [Plicaturopsis crispa FD-325 SS-3]|nr:hypothetical protein PLICRDRAFT_615711 [Plicaturopsis crispa FD-325 SS-3]